MQKCYKDTTIVFTLRVKHGGRSVMIRPELPLKQESVLEKTIVILGSLVNSQNPEGLEDWVYNSTHVYSCVWTMARLIKNAVLVPMKENSAVTEFSNTTNTTHFCQSLYLQVAT